MTSKRQVGYLIAIIALLLLSPASSVFAPRTVDAQAGNLSVTSMADITGDGAAHALQSSVTTARWIQVIATTTNSAAVRLGDSNVSSTRGLPIAAGGGFMFPAVPVDQRESTTQHFYDLSKIYYFAAVGDKLSVAWGR